MLKVEEVKVFNIEGALRGLRNPKNSWDKSDSVFGLTDISWGCDEMWEVGDKYLEQLNLPEGNEEEQSHKAELREGFAEWLNENGLGINGMEGDLCEFSFIGPKDLHLAQLMIGAGTDESKFMRQIFVSMDITAPLYWWKEFDTYKVGTVSDSCSTMHKLTSQPITEEMFSFDNDEFTENWPSDLNIEDEKERIISYCEWLRSRYVETKDQRYWRLLIQELPSSWNQKRTVTLNYQVARAMYFARRHHKLSEWHVLCKAFEKLPYGKELICYEKPKKLDPYLKAILTTLGISPAKKDGSEKTKDEILTEVLALGAALTSIKALDFSKE